MTTAATVTVQEKQERPGTPIEYPRLKAGLPRIWTLFYRYGNIPHIQKAFVLDGSLRDANQRGREHCVRMGYRFICVRPFLVDLEEQEYSKSLGRDIEEPL